MSYTFLNTSNWARWTWSSKINEGMFSTYPTETNGVHEKVRVFVFARTRNCQSGFNHRNHTRTDANVSTPKRQNGKCVLGITQKGNTHTHNKNTKNPFPTLSSMTKECRAERLKERNKCTSRHSYQGGNKNRSIHPHKCRQKMTFSWAYRRCGIRSGEREKKRHSRWKFSVTSSRPSEP